MYDLRHHINIGGLEASEIPIAKTDGVAMTKKENMKDTEVLPTESKGKIKTTIRLHKWIWKAVQHQAIEEDVTAETIVTTALVEYLKGKPGGIIVRYVKPKKGGK